MFTYWSMSRRNRIVTPELPNELAMPAFRNFLLSRQKIRTPSDFDQMVFIFE